jgi:hypothetical protein
MLKFLFVDIKFPEILLKNLLFYQALIFNKSTKKIDSHNLREFIIVPLNLLRTLILRFVNQGYYSSKEHFTEKF